MGTGALRSVQSVHMACSPNNCASTQPPTTSSAAAVTPERIAALEAVEPERVASREAGPKTDLCAGRESGELVSEERERTQAPEMEPSRTPPALDCGLAL